MPELGKIGAAFFEEHIAPNLGADRDDVAIGPRAGVDFGLIDVEGTAIVCATDPVYVLPGLEPERAAWFAVHILLSDVAVSGLAPTHLSVDFNLPPSMSDATFARIWEVFHREAEALGAAVVTGHTARYADCAYPIIGGGTALAVGDPEAVVRPDGARPGDRVLVTKGPAIEATGVLATRFESVLRESVPADVVADATDRFEDTSPVADALLAAEAGGVTAMHDATERGLDNAFVELGLAAGVGLCIDRDRIPVLPGVRETCEAFGIDPWISSSSGTLVLTAAPDAADGVLAAFEDAGVPAAAVGRVTDGRDVRVDGEAIDRPDHDPFWPAYEAALERAEPDR